MAAAEYYYGGANQAPRPPAQPPRPQYPPQPQSQQHLAALPYPISDDPPPYSSLLSAARPHSHSQPPPLARPLLQTPQPSGYQYQHQPGDTHMYPPEKQAHFNNAQQNGAHIPPGNYKPPGRPSPYQQPPSQQGYPSPNVAAPPVQHPYGPPDGRIITPTYPQPPNSSYRDNSSRSRSRSRSRRRTKHKHHHHDDIHHHHQDQQPQRPQYYERPREQQRKKSSSGVSTFLGAGGGAVIGDIIFPGLGTLGGALLGGVGGHEYGKQRRSYSNDRDYYEDNHSRGRRRRESRY